MISKGYYLLGLFLLLLLHDGFGQTGKMTLRKVPLGGVEFVKGGQVLTLRGAMQQMEEVPEAYKLMKKAKNQADFATILGFAGGFMAGWPVGTAIGGGDPDWALAAAGAGLFFLSLPIQLKFKKTATKAIGIYNQDKGFSSIKLQLAPGRVGWVVRF